jgi:hypothetical protein
MLLEELGWVSFAMGSGWGRKEASYVFEVD